MINEKKINMDVPHSLIKHLQVIEDPRVERTKAHNLIDILVIGLCTMLTMGDRFTDMEDLGNIKKDFFESFLELPNGIPSHDTFNRVFSAIDPLKFVDSFLLWVKELCPTLEGDNIALDGKAIRRALNEGDKLTYIISAWASDHGLIVSQAKVDDKSNEITAIPALLESLEISGCVITIDAMGTQKDIAEKIIEKKADYVLALKGNQGNMNKEVREYFQTIPADVKGDDHLDYYETLDKGHGRIEKRCYWQSDNIKWFEDKKEWKGLNSFLMVKSTRTIAGRNTVEYRYFISSMGLNAEKAAKAIRNHWGIENQVHWCLDVTFDEDQSRSRSGHAAQNLALLRRIALNLLKADTSKDLSMRRKRHYAALEPEYLKRLLGI